MRGEELLDPPDVSRVAQVAVGQDESAGQHRGLVVALAAEHVERSAEVDVEKVAVRAGDADHERSRR